MGGRRVRELLVDRLETVYGSSGSLVDPFRMPCRSSGSLVDPFRMLCRSSRSPGEHFLGGRGRSNDQERACDKNIGLRVLGEHPRVVRSTPRVLGEHPQGRSIDLRGVGGTPPGSFDRPPGCSGTPPGSFDRPPGCWGNTPRVVRPTSGVFGNTPRVVRSTSGVFGEHPQGRSIDLRGVGGTPPGSFDRPPGCSGNTNPPRGPIRKGLRDSGASVGTFIPGAWVTHRWIGTTCKELGIRTPCASGSEPESGFPASSGLASVKAWPAAELRWVPPCSCCCPAAAGRAGATPTPARRCTRCGRSPLERSCFP